MLRICLISRLESTVFRFPLGKLSKLQTSAKNVIQDKLWWEIAVSLDNEVSSNDKLPTNINLKDFFKYQRCSLAFLRVIELLLSEMIAVDEKQQDDDLKSKQASDDI